MTSSSRPTAVGDARSASSAASSSSSSYDMICNALKLSNQIASHIKCGDYKTAQSKLFAAVKMSKELITHCNDSNRNHFRGDHGSLPSSCRPAIILEAGPQQTKLLGHEEGGNESFRTRGTDLGLPIPCFDSTVLVSSLEASTDLDQNRQEYQHSSHPSRRHCPPNAESDGPEAEEIDLAMTSNPSALYICKQPLVISNANIRMLPRELFDDGCGSSNPAAARNYLNEFINTFTYVTVYNLALCRHLQGLQTQELKKEEQTEQLLLYNDAALAGEERRPQKFRKEGELGTRTPSPSMAATAAGEATSKITRDEATRRTNTNIAAAATTKSSLSQHQQEFDQRAALDLYKNAYKLLQTTMLATLDAHSLRMHTIVLLNNVSQLFQLLGNQALSVSCCRRTLQEILMVHRSTGTNVISGTSAGSGGFSALFRQQTSTPPRAATGTTSGAFNSNRGNEWSIPLDRIWRQTCLMLLFSTLRPSCVAAAA